MVNPCEIEVPGFEDFVLSFPGDTSTTQTITQRKSIDRINDPKMYCPGAGPLDDPAYIEYPLAFLEIDDISTMSEGWVEQTGGNKDDYAVVNGQDIEL